MAPRGPSLDPLSMPALEHTPVAEDGMAKPIWGPRVKHGQRHTLTAVRLPASTSLVTGALQPCCSSMVLAARVMGECCAFQDPQTRRYAADVHGSMSHHFPASMWMNTYCGRSPAGCPNGSSCRHVPSGGLLDMAPWHSQASADCFVLTLQFLEPIGAPKIIEQVSTCGSAGRLHLLPAKAPSSTHQASTDRHHVFACRRTCTFPST